MVWWRNRSVKLVGSPSELTRGLPGEAMVSIIFQDFRANFRAFELWHLRQRCKLLDCKHKASLTKLFQELRPSKPEQVDTLTVSREYAILAVDETTNRVHLDSEPDCRGFSSWALDSQPVTLKHVSGSTCVVDTTEVLEEGQSVVQTQTLVTPCDVQQEFVSLWRPRWQRHASVPPEAWSRIIAFAQAFLPKANLVLPPLTVSAWRKAVRRFKVYAARGPCGWAKEDLLNLPDAATQVLLDRLHAIECGRSTWPKQWLTGLVCALSKGNSRADANGYRPIVLYSIIYRTWAGLRFVV